MEVLRAKPWILQIADVVPLKLRGSDGTDSRIVFLRVVWLEYLSDPTFYRRVLDIEDDQIAERVLSERVKVTEMSFN